jgi:hypothetical protein
MAALVMVIAIPFAMVVPSQTMPKGVIAHCAQMLPPPHASVFILA